MTSALCALAPMLVLAVSPASLDPGHSQHKLGGHFELLEDPTRALTIDEVAGGEVAESRWRRSDADAPAMGASRSAWWVRMEVENRSESAERWLLEVGYPQLDHVDLYRPGHGGTLSVERSGDLLPYASRRVPASSFVFPLELAAGERQRLFLRVQTEGMLWLPLTLWSPLGFLKSQSSWRLLAGLLGGCFVALGLYNLFLFVTLRDRSYLWYVLYIASFGLATAMLFGVATEYLWPRWPQLDNLVHPAVIAVAAFFASGFASSFLGTRERAPWAHRMLRAFSIGSLAAVAVAPFSHHWGIVLGAALLATTPFAGIAAGIACLRRGFTPARYYLVAWSLLLIALAANSLGSFGLIPSTHVTIYAFAVLGTAEMVLLSFALADRIRVLELRLTRQREQAFHLHKMEALGTLAGGVAHDFNNMLTAIVACAGEIKRGAALEDSAWSSADVIERAGLRAAGLTRQLLGFAQQGRLQEASIDAASLVEEVCALLARTVDKRITIRCEAERGLFLNGDPAQIQQVVLNLAVNARDAMPSGGELTVAALPKTVGAGDPDLPAGEYVALAVRDTGTGISKEVRDKLFEPFFTTKPPGQGTGMGLAMVYGIVRNHRGAIRVTTEVGRGSTFEALLPRVEAPAVAPAAERPAAGGGRVLIIDDEELVLRTTRGLLTARGYQVEAFLDPQEALKHFSRHWQQIDVVLLDLMMPSMTGLDCLRKLREIAPNTRVVATTGYGPDLAVQEMLEAGAVGCVHKPYSAADLAKAIGAAMNATAPRPTGT
ncbi:MAG: 7TM diverse intracellular signaling domain-containing protein [Myxococcales bacterium]|jgi:signal transduction histidine kinase/CheY-like chemotaxis protein